MDRTSEGFSIKLRLTKNRLTLNWLLAELKERGIEINKTYLSECLSGKNQSEDAKKVLITSGEILCTYERFINEI